jgi:hypothetical protein
MTIYTGTTAKGRNLLKNGITAATVGILILTEASGLKFRYKGYFCWELQRSGKFLESPGSGLKIYYQGGYVSAPAATGGNTTNFVLYTPYAGIAWSLETV